jgi:2-aminoethylphosphonate-pyruvate transaminase
MTKPRLAIILAAGRGRRLGVLGEEIPKGFINIGGRTLIERSIDELREAGVQRVRIVTGHLSHCYENLATRIGGAIELAHNPAYATTGSLSSLLCAGPIDEPYLLVESDLLYESRAPRLLMQAPDTDLLLASGATGSGDEVYVAAEDGRLTDLSKDLATLRGSRVGEFVGLTRLSPALHAEVVACAPDLLATGRPVDYETGLVMASRRHPLPVLVIPDLLWTEIDDEHHLARAVERVAPRMRL